MTPLNPPDPQANYQLMGPMEGAPPSHTNFRVRRYLTFLLKYWWVLALTLMAGAGAGVAYLRVAPPNFVSRASMWETERLRLPEGAMFGVDVQMQNYLGTQIALLRSEELGQLAMQRYQASGTNAVPTGRDGRPVQAQVSIMEVPKSTLLEVQVASEDGTFSQAYLNALLNAYFDFKKNLRKSVADDTLASLSEPILRLERELKSEQNTFTDWEGTNNLAILQEEGNAWGEHLAKLETELSDSQLELKFLEANEADRQQGANGGAGTNTMRPEALAGLVATPKGASEENRSAARQIALLKAELERRSESSSAQAPCNCQSSPRTSNEPNCSNSVPQPGPERT